jgi:phage terminase small subunit
VRIAFADLTQAYNEGGNLLPVPQMPEDTRRALSGIEITELFGDGKAVGRLKKVRFAQKVPALDSLAKHLGIFAEPGNGGTEFRIVLNLGGPFDEHHHETGA